MDDDYTSSSINIVAVWHVSEIIGEKSEHQLHIAKEAVGPGTVLIPLNVVLCSFA